MDCEMVKPFPERRRSLTCLRVIPQDIVAKRKRSLFLQDQPTDFCPEISFRKKINLKELTINDHLEGENGNFNSDKNKLETGIFTPRKKIDCSENTKKEENIHKYNQMKEFLESPPEMKDTIEGIWSPGLRKHSLDNTPVQSSFDHPILKEDMKKDSPADVLSENYFVAQCYLTPAAAPVKYLKRRTSDPSGSNEEGVTCTCPHEESLASGRLKHRKDLMLPRLSLLPEDKCDNSTSVVKPKYRRSISLGQILADEDNEEKSYVRQLSVRDGLTSAGSSFAGSSDASPESAPDVSNHELSEFEKENLLFIKKLDNSYHNEVEHGELHPSLSNTSLGSTFSDDSLGDECVPRAGSPYPGRKEYPRSAYSPSRSASSQLIRSISQEEPEVESESDQTCEETKEGEEEDERNVSYSRKISLPVLSFGGKSVRDCETSNCTTTWWETRPQHNQEARQASYPFVGSISGKRELEAGKIPLLEVKENFDWVKESKNLNPQGYFSKGTSVLEQNPAGLDALRKDHGTVPSQSHKSPSSLKDNLPSSVNTSKSPSESSQPEEDASPCKPTPMAFTIDLSTEETSEGGSSFSPKKLDIHSGISKWAPKHRRNHSLTKVDENKVLESFFDENGNSKPPKRRSTIGGRLDKVEEKVGKPPLGRPRSGTVSTSNRKAGGYHSEGYFSSDQDDELPRRADLKSPRTVEAKSSVTTSSVKTPSDNTKNLRTRSPSDLGSSKSMTLNESASFLIEKIINSTPEMKRKQPCRNEGRTCCKGEKKPTVAEIITGKVSKETKEQDHSKVLDNHHPAESGQTFEDMDKENTSPMSRNNPNWIQQWAAQVAEQTTAVKTSPDSSLVSRPNMTSMSSLDSSDSRPRRKLPTPPSSNQHSYSNAQNYQILSPREFSDHENPSKSRIQLWKNEGRLMSDLSSDTESFLRDTELLVTSLQARVDQNKTKALGFRGTSFESHDSGGDSDIDTSTSYPLNNEDCLPPQLKHKLKLSGLEGLYKPQLQSCSSPRKSSPAVPLDVKNCLRVGEFSSDGGYIYQAHRTDACSLNSDSSSETNGPVKETIKNSDNNPPLKYNRAFSLRRARLLCDDVSQPSVTSVEKKKPQRPSSAESFRKVPLSATKSHHSIDNSQSSQNCKESSDSFSRGDGGRYSLRIPRSGSSNTLGKSSSSRVSNKKETNKKGSSRSNSTLSAKEIDFQNWKRRKNYDPMKAAAEGRRKQAEKKINPTTNISEANMLSPPPGSLFRSASFHGSEGVEAAAAAGRWPKQLNHSYYDGMEEDGPYSLEEEFQPVAPHTSPLRRSPTSPQQLNSSPIHSLSHPSTNSIRNKRTIVTNSDGNDIQASPSRKISVEEVCSEGKRSPLTAVASSRGSTCGVSSRSKAKMEALDNLVISTIHSLSVKVRTTSETLLQKLKSQYDEDGDRAALLEEVIAHLSESDQSSSAGQARSTSRELAGILRNLKKIEHALEVIDQVMLCGEDYDLENEDLDGSLSQEWVESDY